MAFPYREFIFSQNQRIWESEDLGILSGQGRSGMLENQRTRLGAAILTRRRPEGSVDIYIYIYIYIERGQRPVHRRPTFFLGVCRRPSPSAEAIMRISNLYDVHTAGSWRVLGEFSASSWSSSKRVLGEFLAVFGRSGPQASP